jgi:DNA repair exonuclease SbcCD ATPase subunit
MRDSYERSSNCNHLLELAEGKVDSQQRSITKLEQVNDERVKEKEEAIKVHENTVYNLQKQIKPIEESISVKETDLLKYHSLNNSLEKLKSLKIKINSKKSVVEKELKFFVDNNVCPTCTQDINIEFKQHRCEDLTSQSETFIKGLVALENDIGETFSKVSELNDTNREVIQLKNNLVTLERDINRCEKESISLQKQISLLKESRPNIQEETEILDALMKDLVQTQNNCADINKQINEYQTVSYLLKDSGIKSTVINKYIPIFNTLINKYLQSMEFYVNFTLDNEFNEVIKSRFRDDFTYSSFSEGEKQKIDLALLFTWREVARMKNSASTNLLILDEVFDSSLDDSSTGELLKILRGLGDNTNLFVISHKGEILVDKFMRTIKFEKVNDFSKLSYDP